MPPTPGRVDVPVIGLTVGHLPAGPRWLDAAESQYSRAVQMAGGAPVLLPATRGTDPEVVVSRLDGLMVTGGGDIDAHRYGAEPSPAAGGVDAERDEVESAIIEVALDRRLPVLGVCRGCQLLNVVLGGTLVQNLPDVTDLNHLVPDARSELIHMVTLEPGSRLESILGADRLNVNSIHHQAIEQLAPGLQSVAAAPDGVIEGIEDPRRPVVGVQWHPESLVPAPEHVALFEWLTGRCHA